MPENYIPQKQESAPESSTRCAECGAVILRAALQEIQEPGHELDLPPPSQEYALTRAVPEPAVYSPVHRPKVDAGDVHKRLLVRGRPDILIYVLGSKPEPPSELDRRFAEFVASTTPEERVSLAEDRRGRLAAESR